jgi:hypothetical protein
MAILIRRGVLPPLVAGTTFDPAQTGAGLTLSAGNLTATLTNVGAGAGMAPQHRRY